MAVKEGAAPKYKLMLFKTVKLVKIVFPKNLTSVWGRCTVASVKVCLKVNSPPSKWFTVSSRGRLSLTAPTQPRQPITMMMAPTAMSRLAADREGRDDDRVAKFPWVTESHTPTPSMPHPPNCRGSTEMHRDVRAITTWTFVKRTSSNSGLHWHAGFLKWKSEWRGRIKKKIMKSRSRAKQPELPNNQQRKKKMCLLLSKLFVRTWTHIIPTTSTPQSAAGWLSLALMSKSRVHYYNLAPWSGHKVQQAASVKLCDEYVTPRLLKPWRTKVETWRVWKISCQQLAEIFYGCLESGHSQSLGF